MLLVACRLLTLMLLVLSLILSILFPPLQVVVPKGPFQVGVVDHYLPVDDRNLKSNGSTHGSSSLSHVPVRILYPTSNDDTNNKISSIPYIHDETSVAFCEQLMRFGAPTAFLKNKCAWMLHHWRLARLNATPNAKLIDDDKDNNKKMKHDVVIFSHGLGGNAAIYSYQTMALASHGYIVVALNHQDGSAPLVKTVSGDIQTYDFELGKIWSAGRHEDYVRARRARTEHRTEEVLAVAESFLELNDNDSKELQQFGLSFRRRLGRLISMGHSYGGATALTAAKRRPDLIQAVVAHEPAIDWMPDDVRRSLFPEGRLAGLPHTYNGGTGGYSDKNDEKTEGGSIHDVDLLFLWSQEWRDLKWAASDILESMHRHGRLGRMNSDYHVIRDSRHSEFSDTCMMTPLWLARATGITGKRNPYDTANEIEVLTRAFLYRAVTSKPVDR